MKLIFACLLGLYAVPTTAGTMSGGGGGQVVVCKTKGVETVQLLDLWEAQNFHNLSLIAPIGNLAADVDRALVALRDSYPVNDHGGNQDVILSELRVTASYFLHPHPYVHWLRGTRLDDTKDAYPIGRPENCPPQNIVNYQPRQIFINKDLFDKMDEQNQAALIVHEALYALLRNWANETNSIRVRRSVGYVFAGYTFTLPTPTLPAQALECTSVKDSSDYYMDDLWLYTEPPDPSGYTNIAAFVGSLWDSHLMAVHKPLIVYSEGTPHHEIADFINSGHCEGWKNKKFTTETAYFVSPIEGDRSLTIAFQCESGHLSFARITTTTPGGAWQHQANLTCKIGPTPSWREKASLPTPPADLSPVSIADGKYHCAGGSDGVLRATYSGKTLVGVSYDIPKNHTRARMACTGNLCSGVFSGFSGTYSIKITSRTSYIWENSNFYCNLMN